MIYREDVSLRQMIDSDLARVLQWRNSDHVRKYMFTDHIISYQEHLDWFNKIKYDKSKRYYIFEHQGVPCGVTNFTGLDFHNKKGFLGIYIGENRLIKGLGSSSLYLTLESYFETLQFNKIYAEVFAFNTKAINLYQKFGFIQEGLFKNHVLKNGRYEDVYLYSLFNDAWFKNKQKLYDLIFSNSS